MALIMQRHLPRHLQISLQMFQQLVLLKQQQNNQVQRLEEKDKLQCERQHAGLTMYYDPCEYEYMALVHQHKQELKQLEQQLEQQLTILLLAAKSGIRISFNFCSQLLIQLLEQLDQQMLEQLLIQLLKQLEQPLLKHLLRWWLKQLAPEAGHAAVPAA